MPMKRKMIQCATKVNRDAIKHESIDGVDHIVITSFTLPEGIVMNGGLYPAEEVNNSFHTLERTLAPVEHPQDSNGNYISASDPIAIHNYHAGAFNTNVSKDGDRIKIDKFINVQEAKKTDRGKRLLDRIHEIETSDDPRPIHTSVGVFLVPEELSEPQTNAAGQEYTWIAREMTFDHDAILLDSVGAAQPHQGVGIGVNANGDECEVQNFYLNQDIEAKPIPNPVDMSHDEIREALFDAINVPPIEGDWIVRVFDSEFIFEAKNQLFSAPYTIVERKAKIVGIPVPVERDETFKPKTNNEGVAMKKQIINALAKLNIHINGALADRLNNLIESKSSDNDERSDLIDRMASAAGISRGTLLQILRGDIETPPENRLEGFADVLGVSLESLKSLVDNNKEGEAMKDLILNALKAAGIEVNEETTEDQLLVKYNEMLSANQQTDDGLGEGNDKAEFAEVVTNLLKPLTEKLEGLEVKLNAQSEAEKAQAISAIVNSGKYPGLDAESAALLSADKLKEMATNCGVSYGVSPMVNHSNQDEKFKVSSDMPE